MPSVSPRSSAKLTLSTATVRRWDSVNAPVETEYVFERPRASRRISPGMLILLGGNKNSGVDHIDVGVVTRLYDVSRLQSRMKVGAIVGHRRFHQPARLYVFTVRAFPAGDMHPMIERARVSSNFRRNDTEPRRSKNPVKIAPRERTRMGMVAYKFDPMVHLANFWIFRDQDVEHADAASR